MGSSRPEEPVGPCREDASADDAARRARGLERMTNLHMMVLGLAVAVALLWLLSDVILLLFAATLIACQLQGAAVYLARHTKLPYGPALGLVVLTIAAGLGLAFWLRGPGLASEARTIYDQVNIQVANLWQSLGDAEWLQGVVRRVQIYLRSMTGHMAGMAAGFVTTTLGSVGSVLLIVVIAIYLAASPKQYVRGLIALLPQPWRRRGGEIMAQEGHTLRWWFFGQLVDMAAIGVLTGAGLLFLGVKLWFTLGLIAALCNFVPYVGALAGSVPAIVVGLSEGPRTAVYVAILFIAVQTIEGNVIAPMIQRRTVDLPPVITLLSQTVLGTLFGPFGLILATPITAVSLVLVRMLYIETILGDHRRPEPT